MEAGQKSVGANGKQNFLFPFTYMYITQGEDPDGTKGAYSHRGSYAMDFQGWGQSGRVFRCPYYAPFDCTCTRVGSDSSVWWVSNDEVNFPDGTTSIATIVFAHDNNFQSRYVGETRRQGDLIGNTGTAGNVTGDHGHIETAKGRQTQYVQNQFGVYMVANSSSNWQNMYVDGTFLIVSQWQGSSYNWRTIGTDPPDPPDPPIPTHREPGLINLWLCDALYWGKTIGRKY